MVQRNYSVPDADCIQQAKAVRLLYLERENDFKAFDPVTFDANFASNWLKSLDDSTDQETAESRLDQQGQETLDVLGKMAESRKLYISTKYFIEKAFSNKPKLMDRFGLDNYEEASQKQALMVPFLRNLYLLCDSADLKPELIAVGLDQVRIDAIRDLAALLDKEETEQDSFILDSGSATQDRINQYNATFAFWQAVARASKSIYYDNLVLQNIFELPHGSAGVEYKLEGKVTDGSNNNANLKDVIVAIVEINFATVTNAYGNYGYVDVPPGNYTLRFTLDGYVEQNIPFTITQSGKVTKNVSLVVG